MKNGKITISRCVLNQGGDYIEIEIHGGGIGLVLKAEIEPSEFALALTGLGLQKCKFKTFVMINKKVENENHNNP